jgi:hypothetical protein
METVTLEKTSSSKKKEFDREEFRKLPLKERARLLDESVLPNNLTEEEIVAFCSKVRAERYKKQIQWD